VCTTTCTHIGAYTHTYTHTQTRHSTDYAPPCRPPQRGQLEGRVRGQDQRDLGHGGQWCVDTCVWVWVWVCGCGCICVCFPPVCYHARLGLVKIVYHWTLKSLLQHSCVLRACTVYANPTCKSVGIAIATTFPPSRLLVVVHVQYRARSVL
jgi:hypothetical protein